MLLLEENNVVKVVFNGAVADITGLATDLLLKTGSACVVDWTSKNSIAVAKDIDEKELREAVQSLVGDNVGFSIVL